MITKSFKEWDSEEVEDVFGLTRLWNQLKTLEDWIAFSEEINTKEEEIEELKELLLLNADAWNEDELKMFFIAPLLNDLKFHQLPHFKAFTQRTLHIQTDKVDSKGDVEFIVATGRKKPKKPFFFLYEYKQEEKRNNDALGQLLIAMVAAKLQNEEQSPLYGCYVLGRFWFFVVLEKDKYSVSNAFNASDKDIYKIVEILKRVKEKIQKALNLI